MTDTLKTKTESAMKVLSDLSKDAKTAGNNALMYAANRAWHELYDQRWPASSAEQKKSAS